MRRTLRRAVAWPVVLVLLLVACGESGSGGEEDKVCAEGVTDGDLLLFNWSDYIDPNLITDFESQYPVKVIPDYFDSNEQLLSRLQQNAVFDIIVPSDYMVGIMIIEDILAPLQRDAIPNLVNLDPVFANPPYDPGGVYSAAYQWGTTGLGVNLSVVGEDFDPSWALVFDPAQVSQYPGGFSLLNDPRETMGAALMYLGYSINSTNESELEEASNVISGINSYITSFDSDRYASNLVNGETAVAHGYSGGFVSAFDDSDDPDNWAYVIPKEGGTLWTDNMAIPRTASHPCTAHAFINFILDAENGAVLSEYNWYASPNQAAMEFLDEDMVNNPIMFPDDAAMARLQVIVDTGEFELKFNDYFTRARN